MRRKWMIGVALGMGAVLALAGCTSSSDSVSADKNQTNAQLDRYQKNQPVPQFDRSQYRQTLIDVEQAQVHGVATTTFFYNLGGSKPIKFCPSIGFPVPTTSQLTNPDQLYVNGNGHDGVVGQQEPNGAYTGDSSGTYVVCVLPNGLKRIDYWEGHVETEGGSAHWDASTQMIVDDGAPTVTQK
jgi:hypothetical protein